MIVLLALGHWEMGYVKLYYLLKYLTIKLFRTFPITKNYNVPYFHIVPGINFETVQH